MVSVPKEKAKIVNRLKSLRGIPGVNVTEKDTVVRIKHANEHALDFKFTWSHDHFIGYFIDNKKNESQAVISLKDDLVCCTIRSPIWEEFQEITADIPDEEWAKLPMMAPSSMIITSTDRQASAVAQLRLATRAIGWLFIADDIATDEARNELSAVANRLTLMFEFGRTVMYCLFEITPYDRAIPMPTIRASDARSWKACIRRAWYDHHPPAGWTRPEPEEFDSLTAKAGADHEKAVLRRLEAVHPVVTAESPAHTTELIAQRRRHHLPARARRRRHHRASGFSDPSPVRWLPAGRRQA